MQEWMPEMSVILTSLALSLARFENQRWIRYRNTGRRGINIKFGLFVDLTGGVALLFSFAFVAIYAYMVSWKYALSLVAMNLVIAPLTEIFFGGDAIWKWIAGTIMIWFLMPALVFFAFVGEK